MKRVGTLQVDEDLGYQRKEWIVERFGWAGMILFLVAALLGLFGSGPLSNELAVSGDGAARVNYSKFLRRDSSAVLEVQFLEKNMDHEFALSNELLSSWNIQQFTPEPAVAQAAEGRTLFRFEGKGPGRISLEYKPRKPGRIAGSISLPGDQTVRIRQFVMP